MSIGTTSKDVFVFFNNFFYSFPDFLKGDFSYSHPSSPLHYSGPTVLKSLAGQTLASKA
jgi:hypothetical protein